MSSNPYAPVAPVGARRQRLVLGLVAAVLVGVLAGVVLAYWRAQNRPEVTVVQAQTVVASPGAVEVPASAVVTDAGQKVVYVVVNGVVIRQPVQVGSTTGATVLVTAGLSPHAPVVTSPVDLHDGEKVRTP